MLHLDVSIIEARHELLSCAQGSLAVALTHLQLARHRLADQPNRLAQDHIDTAEVFATGVMDVLATLEAGSERMVKAAQVKTA